MGSFNVACSVSNISLGCGDPAVYIPLEVSKYPYKIGDTNNMLIYTHCFYSPMTLPLFGEYNDYGVLDIEEDENSKLVKEKFEIKDWDEMFSEKTPSGMFIHRAVYDVLFSKHYSEYEGKKQLPFYGVTSMTDEFKKHISKLKENIDEEKSERTKWMELHEELKTERIKDMSKIFKDKNYHPLKYYDKYPFWNRGGISSIFKFDNYDEFNKLYQPEFLKGRFEKEAINFLLFECGLAAVNSFYFPACNGYQHGNPWMSRVLYRTANKLMNDKIKEIKKNL